MSYTEPLTTRVPRALISKVQVPAGTYQVTLHVPDHECEVHVQQLFGNHWDNIGGILPDNSHTGSRSATLGPFVLTEGSQVLLDYPFSKYPEGVAATLERIS